MRKSHPHMLALIRLVSAVVAISSGSAHTLEAASAQERIQPDPRTPYFQLRSDRSVGDHGEVELDVSVTDNHCGLQLRFDHAELKILRNRFGDAQFIRLPQPGCEVCEPILLRWMHEPTGYLEVNVNIFRREVDVPCEEES